MDKDFKTFWDKKAKKRRKSWESKLQRRIANHSDIESIRKDVFKPFNEIPAFSYATYMSEHRTLKNPFVEWKKNAISFSEQGLRDALQQNGADLSEYKFTDEHESVKDGFYTDVETFTLTLRSALMTIKRFSTKGVPFGYYEITPTEQYAKGFPMRMEETGFYTLNIATLLMDMAAECDLREEEFMYYVKGLRIAGIHGAVAEDIEFKLWDEEQIPAKIKGIINRSQYHSEHTVIKSALNPWMKAIEQFMINITHADEDKNGMLFTAFNRNDWTGEIYSVKDYVDNVFLPYLASQNMSDVTIDIINRYCIFIQYKGYKMFIAPPTTYQEKWKCLVYPYLEETDSNWKEIIAYPNAIGNKDVCSITFNSLTVSAIASFLKIMPKYKDQIYGMKAKILKAYKEIVK